VRKLPSRKLLGAVIAAALLIPSSGFTLGLGEIEVNSALNQKLNADIELLSAAPEDSETIIVKLASRKQFTRAGLDRPYLLNDLRFKTEMINGVPHIKVSSSGPIREPFLNFLVEIDWPNGHLLREYTVLLDPPVFMTQPAAAPANQGGTPSNAGFRPTSGGSTNVVPVATPGMSASARPGSSAMAAPSTVNQVAPQSQPTWVPTPVMQQQASINQPVGSYKIKSGDTAWSLADAMRPDQSITVPQMMVAMLRANPESFINENINGLKRGYILRVPDYEQIASISSQEAQALVREQAALWRQYQQSQSGGQPVSAMEADMDDIEPGSGMDVGDDQSDAYLEIVSAGSGSSTMSGKDPTEMSARELRAELARAREKVETSLVEKEELQQRVETLQQHVDKMKGMLSIEDTEMAEVQSLGMPAESNIPAEMTDDTMAEGEVMDGAEDSAMTTDEERVDMSDETAIAEAMMDEAVEEEAVDGEMTDGEEAVFVDESEANSDEMSDAMMEEAPAQVVPDTQIAPQIDTAPQDPISKLLNNPMMLAAAGGGLLLIAALIGLIIKRRKKPAEEAAAVSNGFDDLESLADDIAEETADDEVKDVVNDVEDAAEDFDSDSTMILDSAEDTIIAEADESAAEDDEPRDDVIAEADVYLAYGIYQQAEELLTQAIADNPDRDDYRVKLAETHYAGKDSGAFVKAASDLKSRVKESSPSWKKVAVMGQDLCADNPMFQGSLIGNVTDVDALTADAPEMDFDLGLDDEDTGDSSDLDLSLGDDPLELPDDDNSDPVDELAFDLNEAGAEDEAADSEDEFSLDIDASELDIETEEDTTATDSGDSEEIDLSDLDIGLDDVTDSSAEIDLDFGLDDVKEEPAEEEDISLDLTDVALDMDLELDDSASLDDVPEAAVEEQPAESVAASPELSDDDEEDFDLSSLDDVDEISTKLDLARAYLDMGDHEGTKGILEEVLADGNDEQKQEANDLMAKLD